MSPPAAARGLFMLICAQLCSSCPAAPHRSPLLPGSPLVNMVFHALTDLKPGARHWKICVCVSRMWEYRGGTDSGPIQYVDLVLVDEKGNAMYAEIAADDVEEKAGAITEGHVYALSRFMVSPGKRSYKAVEAPYLINFTYHTVIEEITDVPAGFPLFVCDPVPFPDLPAYVGENTCFIDIVGIIVSVSDATTLRIARQPAPTTKRTIILRDASNYEMKLTLWGRSSHRVSC